MRYSTELTGVLGSFCLSLLPTGAGAATADEVARRWAPIHYQDVRAASVQRCKSFTRPSRNGGGSLRLWNFCEGTRRAF
jgi:hypothetical protein